MVKKYGKFGYIFVLLALVFIFILVRDDQQYPKVDVTYVPVEDTNNTCIYYINQNKQLIGIPIAISSLNQYDLISEVFSFLTEKSNSISTDYMTYLVPSTFLQNYVLRGKDIVLNVSRDFYRYDKKEINYLLAQILYTYKELGYQNVYLQIEDEEIKQLDNVILTNGIPQSAAINIVYETPYVVEAQIVKINFSYPNGSKIFFNYVVDKTIDKAKFIMDKSLDFINKEYKQNYQYTSYKLNENKCSFYFSEALPAVKLQQMINDSFGTLNLEFILM